MRKIIKQIGFEGRTTIPLSIREEMGINDKDFISFEVSEDGNSMTIRKEYFCDGCQSEEEEEDERLKELLKGQPPMFAAFMRYILGLEGDE